MASISILERCLLFLELLADAPEGLQLGELSARAGLPKSATHRMLSSLVESGFVSQTETREYRLTMKMVTLSFRFLGQTGLLDHCQVVLNRLALEVRELVRMTIVDDDHLVWVAKAQGARGSLVVDPVMGQDVALHATATGKAWLASLPSDYALKIVLRDGFGTPQQHGPNVLQSAEALIKELKKTRDRGFGFAWEEADPGIAAVAVGIPLSSEIGSPLVGTLSIAGPVFRLNKETLFEFVPKLQEASRELCELVPFLRSRRPEFAAVRQAKKTMN